MNGNFSTGLLPRKNFPTRWFTRSVSEEYGTIANFPIVAPVIAISKSPALTLKSFTLLILFSSTYEHSKRFRLSWLIEPILMTLMPLSVHQELLNANPDFIEQ